LIDWIFRYFNNGINDFSDDDKLGILATSIFGIVAMIFFPMIRKKVLQSQFNLQELRERAESYFTAQTTLICNYAFLISTSMVFFIKDTALLLFFMICPVAFAFYLIKTDFFKNGRSLVKGITECGEVACLSKCQYVGTQILSIVMLFFAFINPVCLVLTAVFLIRARINDIISDAKIAALQLDDFYIKKEEIDKCDNEERQERVAKYPFLEKYTEGEQKLLTIWLNWFNKDGLKISHCVWFLVLSFICYRNWRYIDFAFSERFIAITFILLDLIAAYLSGKGYVRVTGQTKVIDKSNAKTFFVYDIVMSFLLLCFILSLVLHGYIGAGLSPELLSVVFGIRLFYPGIKLLGSSSENLKVTPITKTISSHIVTSDCYIKCALLDCLMFFQLLPSPYYSILLILLIILLDAYTPFRQAIVDLVERDEK
jgi:hypothetical protein